MMRVLRQFFKDKFKHYKKTFFALIFLFFYSVALVYAIPPTTPYQPGESLDPNCAPGDTNCLVQIIPDQTGESGKLLSTNGTNTLWVTSVPLTDGDKTDVLVSGGGGTWSVESIGGDAVTLGGAFTTVGNFSTTFVQTGTTALILPETGTLATLAGAESLTNKKLGSLTTDGFVRTNSGDGTLSVDTTTYQPTGQSWLLANGGTLTGTNNINQTASNYAVNFTGSGSLNTVQISNTGGGGGNTARLLITGSLSDSAYITVPRSGGTNFYMGGPALSNTHTFTMQTNSDPGGTNIINFIGPTTTPGKFQTNTVDRMFLSASGTAVRIVGIGTTTSELLRLDNSASANKLLILDNGQTTFSYPTLGSNSGVTINVTATDATSNTQKALEVLQSGANSTSTQTTYGGFFTNTKTGTSANNVAGYFSASGGTTNYGLQVPSGNVSIGTASTTGLLSIVTTAQSLASGGVYIQGNGANLSIYPGTSNRGFIDLNAAGGAEIRQTHVNGGLNFTSSRGFTFTNTDLTNGYAMLITTPIATIANRLGVSITSSSSDTGGSYSSFRITGSHLTTATSNNDNGIELLPTLNYQNGTNTYYGLKISYTLTGVAGLTNYAIASNAGRWGNGTLTPTAKLHVRGDGTTTGELLRLDDSASANRLLVLDNGTSTFTSDAGSTPFRFQTSTATNYVGLNPGTTSNITFGNPSGALSIGIHSGAANGIWTNANFFAVRSIYFTNDTSTDTLAPTIFRTTGNSGVSTITISGGRSAVNTIGVNLTTDLSSITTGTSTIAGIGTTITDSSGAFNVRGFTVAPTYNFTDTHSGTVTGYVYNPTLTSMTGVSAHYAFTASSGLSGFGTLTPTAKLQVVGDGTTTGELVRFNDNGGTNRFLQLDNGNLTITGATHTFAPPASSIQFNHTGTTTYSYSSGATTFTNSSSSFVFNTPGISSGSNFRITNSNAYTSNNSHLALTGTWINLGSASSLNFTVNGLSATPVLNLSDATSTFTTNFARFAPTGTFTTGTLNMRGFVYDLSGYTGTPTTNYAFISNAGLHGFGTLTPTAKVEIQGGGSTSSTSAFRVLNSSAFERYLLRDDGTSVQSGPNTSATSYDFSRLSFGAVPSTGTNIYKVFRIDPVINATGGTSTFTGIQYLPTETSMTGVTHYGLIIDSPTALSGFGLASPTAKLHVKGNGTGSGELFKLVDSASATKFLVRDNGNADLSGELTINSSITSTAPSSPLILDTPINGTLNFRTNGSNRYTISGVGAGVMTMAVQGANTSPGLTITQPAHTAGTHRILRLNGGAYAGVTASTEVDDVLFDLARTVTWDTGSLTTQRFVRITAPTIAFSGASTVTDAATLAISGAPITGTNATLTNSYALWIESGTSMFAGAIRASALTVAGSSQDALCIVNGGTEIQRNNGAQTCTVSSARFKHDINLLSDNTLLKLRDLKPSTFIYNGQENTRIGLVAEDVVQIDPRLVFFEEDGTTPRGVRYEDLSIFTLKGLQELDIKVSSIQDFTDSTFKSAIVTWLADVNNGIGRLFADEFVGNVITANEKLCVGQTCVTEAQLQNLLNSAPASVVPPTEPEPETETVVPDPEPTPIPEETAPENP